jgi:hypothetical protein
MSLSFVLSVRAKNASGVAAGRVRSSGVRAVITLPAFRLETEHVEDPSGRNPHRAAVAKHRNGPVLDELVSASPADAEQLAGPLDRNHGRKAAGLLEGHCATSTWEPIESDALARASSSRA